MDLTNGYYCFKLKECDDLLDIWKGSPWIFDGKILVLKL